MASTTWLHSPAFTHKLLPVIHCPAAFLRRNNIRRPHHFTISLSLICLFVEFCIVWVADDLKFEGKLKIVEYPDPILRAKNKRIKEFDEDLKRLVDEMFDVMYKTDGIGLSAPQVGINVQLMEIVLVNPQIQRYSRKIVPYEEGCLSFPGIHADVERPDSLKVDAQDISGARFEVNLSGLPARVFQHEYDHLQGILFFDRMSDVVIDSIRAELQTREHYILIYILIYFYRMLNIKYEERTGLSSPERIDARRRSKKPAGFGKS
ncbi:hypothetical protein ACJIZ3_007884 [Penstemon smallii]|uniref:Peptide deformylase n=1 Tax=Penstemon smallii TaxID=265156 RepID=A0ABD3TA58_9LAMI